jgi:hypothetical protein
MIRSSVATRRGRIVKCRNERGHAVAKSCKSALAAAAQWSEGDAAGADARRPDASIAFSSEVDTGSREENASKQEVKAPVLIQSEPE